MNAPARRGACPRLLAPMLTGDGLLARIVPTGETIGLDAFASLCEAARAHGNGIIEITSRGSIQVRGLSAGSTQPFAMAVDALGIDSGDTIPVLASPLSGLDPSEAGDVRALAADLRRRLTAARFTARLSAKVSVLLDGGGALHLDGVAADVRLRVREGRFDVALGGDAAAAVPMGGVGADRAGECVVRLLDVLSEIAPRARMRDAIRGEGLSAFTSAVADVLTWSAPPAGTIAPQPIGMHALRGGCVALGLALPFGHADTGMLMGLTDAARRAGSSGFRTAPGRVLLVLGLTPAQARELAASARLLGFIADPDDARCKVIACAGSPICASGQMPARLISPKIAEAARGLLAETDVIHVSGCSKGCAHPAPAALAVFGRGALCDIQADGRPAGSVDVQDLPGRIAQVLQSRRELCRG